MLTQNLPHGKLCIGFTPDEEIGEGADLFDLDRFGADFAYTVDGGDVGGIEYENFNAASATVTIHGLSVHTGSAKNAMINASNVAMEFHMALPLMARPETTEGRQGFFHLCQMYGDVNEAKLGLHPAGPRRLPSGGEKGRDAPAGRLAQRPLRRGHRHGGAEGRLPQHDRKDQAPTSTWWRTPAPPSGWPAWSRRKSPSGAAPTAPS